MEPQKEEYEEEKDDVKSDDDLLKAGKEELKQLMEDEHDNRSQMLDDLKFCSLDQWDERIRSERENDPNGPRPCLTIDKINQYIGQVTNDMRKNKPAVKVRPTDDKADVDTAKVIQGIVRHIEDQSSAQVAYETAGEWAVKVGVGYFRVITDYISENSFDQEIKVQRISDAFCVYMTPHSMPDGSDAEGAYVVEKMSVAKFKEQYPGKKCEDTDFLEDLAIWKEDDQILVCDRYYTEYEEKTLLFLKSGESIFSDEYDGSEDNIVKKRNALEKKIKWCRFTGTEILEKNDWIGKYIPIIEVIGKESIVNGKRMLWGLVRPAKDNLRMYNYWASAITEKIGLSPKTPYIGAVGQFATQGHKWADANRVNYPFLEYDPIDVNGNAIPGPRRGEPAPIEGAMINMLQMIDRDVQTSLGMFKAAVGESESQQSGKAILALQNESDTGTFHFQDNLNRSIRHCGRIIIDLIPKVMDTKRIARILGEDGEYDQAIIDPKQVTAVRQMKDMSTGNIKKIYNPGIGTYDLSVTVGPSYSTKRQEAAEAMLKITSTNPQEMALIGDLMFKSMDWPMADEVAKRHKAMLPPQILASEESPDMPPQAIAQIAQVQQQAQQMQAKLQELGQENMQLKSGAQVKQAELQMKSQGMQVELQLKQQIQQSELQLEQVKVQQELELERQKAQAQIEIQQMKLNFDMQSKQQERQTMMETDQLPKIMEGMQSAFTEMGAILQQQLQMQQQTLEAQNNILAAIQAPKSVAIGNVKKDKDGKIIGATVNTTIK